MTSIEDQIAAHPVAKAAVEWVDTHSRVRHTPLGRVADAEAALVAALDADERRAGDLQHHLTPLIGRIRIQPILTDEHRLSAIEKLVKGIQVLAPDFDVTRSIRPFDADQQERPGTRQALEAAYEALTDALGSYGTTGPTAQAMRQIARAILSVEG